MRSNNESWQPLGIGRGNRHRKSRFEWVSYTAFTQGRGKFVRLMAADFKQGPVRITRPAKVVLGEDVVFDARPQVQTVGPHSRGWVYAISIEASDVSLNFKGYSLSQSRRQNLESRFYTHVLLGKAFFIREDQGPFNMGGSAAVERISIRNAVFGLSSHFHIFSPASREVSIENVVCKDFEVAAIQLNASSQVTISRADIGPSARPAKLTPAFTHLQLIWQNSPNPWQHQICRGWSSQSGSQQRELCNSQRASWTRLLPMYKKRCLL